MRGSSAAFLEAWRESAVVRYGVESVEVASGGVGWEPEELGRRCCGVAAVGSDE